MAEDNPKEKKQLLQQKYMEMQMISQQIQQIQKQLELIENQLQELMVTKEALKTIGKTKEGNAWGCLIFNHEEVIFLMRVDFLRLLRGEAGSCCGTF